MPEYYVTSHAENNQSRIQVIKADYFRRTEHGVYDFYNRPDGSIPPGTLVASVPGGVFSVVEVENAYKADFVVDLYEGEEDDPDVCAECQVADEYDELLESEAFWDRVWDVVDAWHEPDEPETEAAKQPGHLTVYRAERKQNISSYDTNPSWGFTYSDPSKGGVFIPFGNNQEKAVRGLERHNGGERGWYTWPISETEPVEDTIQ